MSEHTNAKKNIIEVPVLNGTIPHATLGEFSAAKIVMKPAAGGTGVIAGGPARIVCDMAGIKNIRTKSLGSNNKQNVVLATIAGLSKVMSPEEVAAKRGKSASDVRA